MPGIQPQLKERIKPQHTAKGREWKMLNARIRRFLTVTARDDEDFQRIFNMAGEETPGRLPEGKMAVAIFLGEFTNGTHMPEITKITEKKDEIIIEFDDTANKGGKRGRNRRAGATVMSSPVLVTLLPRSDKKIRFKPANGLTPMGMLMRKRRGISPRI